ncbi:MAG TPA: hypothetical protein ENI65_07825 [Gammaproteobacteria bacterium]|nr:hypothetical protein [Gammaproteobacteria bacterium]
MKLVNIKPLGILACTLLLATSMAPVQVSAAPPEPEQTEQLQRMRTLIGLLQDFMNVIESVHAMSDNPEKAAIYQMYKIEEIYKARGQSKRAIKLFQNILNKTDNLAIRNAVYMRLGDLQKNHRNNDALEIYEQALKENINRMK